MTIYWEDLIAVPSKIDALKCANLPRLERLRKIMRAVPYYKVNMNRFYDNDHEAPHCGSVACMLGHAAVNAENIAEGLKPGIDDSSGLPLPRYYEREGGVLLNTYSGFSAGAMFYGLTMSWSRWLFQESNDAQYNHHWEALRRLDKIIAEVIEVQKKSEPVMPVSPVTPAEQPRQLETAASDA